MLKHIGWRLLVALCLFLGGWSDAKQDPGLVSKPSEDNEKIDLQISTEVLKIAKGDQFDARDLVVSGVYDSLNVPIVDTQTVGLQEITFRARKGLDTITVSTSVEIVENKGPEISYGTRFLLDYGDQSNILDYYYGSSKDGQDVTLEVIGSYDPYTPGESMVQLRAVDKEGNVTTRDITVIVGQKPTVRSYQNNSYQNSSNSYRSYQGNGYAPGWCTWWAAQRRLDMGKGIPSFWGNAINWGYGAANSGFQTGSVPQAGAIVYFPGVNHVAFVESVNGDGSVTISEMGWNFSPWVKNIRTLDANYARRLGYIY